ncbi:MAG: ABC transporter ATP-binding protein [Akkermansiaceae bacterium]
MSNSSYFLSGEKLTKRFPSATRGGPPAVIFENINFGLKEGEFVCCLGHSGCGKSTILNILAGLDQATEGVVIMDGKEITGPSLQQAVVFQSHSLLPWLTTLQNVTIAVRARWPEWSKEQIRDHSLHFLKLVGLDQVTDRKPHQLSGGMKQRVGIARAFAIDARLLLMDEPFGALDALTRGTIQEELVKIWGKSRKTVFMITHDIDEAILLSDRIFLMTNGPNARIAESVVIDLPRPRTRAEIIHHPDYYKIRNHLVDFLVKRSHELAGSPPPGGPLAPDGSLAFPPDVHPARRQASEGARALAVH